MKVIDIGITLDGVTDAGNTTTNTIETGDITIKNQNGSNPVDAGSLYFTEAGATWGTNMYGFRFNQDGATNKFHLQSGNLTTTKTLLTFERDSGDVGIGEALNPVATLHISSSGDDSTTDAFFVENGVGTDLFTIADDGIVSIFQSGSTDSMIINNSTNNESLNSSTWIGNKAGEGTTISGYGHTFVGDTAGQDYTGGGFGVTGLGARALASGSGNYNTAVGYSAARDVIGNQNTAVGLAAGQRSEGGTGTGNNNVSIGFFAGWLSNATSDNNTFIGTNTGRQTSNIGSGNTVLGSSILNTSTEAISNTVVIGSYNQERLRIKSTGQFVFDQYTTASAYEGNAEGLLGFDSSGNIVTVVTTSISTPTLQQVTDVGSSTTQDVTVNKILLTSDEIGYDGGQQGLPLKFISDYASSATEDMRLTPGNDSKLSINTTDTTAVLNIKGPGNGDSINVKNQANDTDIFKVTKDGVLQPLYSSSLVDDSSTIVITDDNYSSVLATSSVVIGAKATSGSTSMGSDGEYVIIGYEAGSDLTGQYGHAESTIVGYQAGKDTDSRFSTYIGHQAGYQSSGSSRFDENTFIGRHAGNYAVGGWNTYIGDEAGDSAWGNNNVSVGGNSFYQVGGSEANKAYGNTVMGYNALGVANIGGWDTSARQPMSNNIVIGHGTAARITMSDGNTIIGANIMVGDTNDYSDTVVIGSYNKERLYIFSDGAYRFEDYGQGDYTGTAAYTLAVDASGNVIETSATPSTPTLQQVTDEDNSLTTQITTSAAIVTSAYPGIYSDGDFNISSKTYGAHTASISGFHGLEFFSNSYTRFKDFSGATKALISSAGFAAFGTGSLFSSPPQLHTVGTPSIHPFRVTIKPNSLTEVDVFNIDTEGIVTINHSGSDDSIIVNNTDGSLNNDLDYMTVLGVSASAHYSGTGMSGYDHTLIGHNAGTDYSGGGFGLTGVGGYALYNTTGSYNTAFGYRAHELANGSFNVFLGMGAGKQVVGGNNVGVGFEAGQRHSDGTGTGNSNISIGHRAGKYVNSNSDQNLFIGFNTANSASLLGSNNTIIGGNLLASSVETVSDTVVIGSYNQERLRVHSSGQFKFDSYTTASAYEGGEVGYLGFDDSGNIVTIPTASGGDVGGTGEANKVTIWENASTITSDTNLHWDTANDRLGIGTATPSYTLDVNGNINGTNVYVGSSIIHEGNTDTKIDFETNTQRFFAEGEEMIKFNSSLVVINEAAGSNDFQVKGNTDNHLIFTDGDVDKVGIGTSSPSEKLDVQGNIKLSASLLSYQENTDVDSAATETVAAVSTDYDCAFFDYIIKNGTDLRAGTVTAVHDGTNVEYVETSTNDLGDTTDVTLSVDIDGTDLRLRATVLTDNWSVKTLVRTI